MIPKVNFKRYLEDTVPNVTTNLKPALLQFKNKFILQSFLFSEFFVSLSLTNIYHG